MKLNLGCADRHLPGYLNVDIAEPCDKIVDLGDPWPWPDSSVDEVQALDLCEHVGMRLEQVYEITGTEVGWTEKRPVAGKFVAINGRIHFMNELHRVLKPGGRATIETPDASRGVGYLQDPTHVSPWCASTFKYFEHGSFAHTRLAKSYGITAAFRIVSMEFFSTPGEGYREIAWKIKAVLEAVKL